MEIIYANVLDFKTVKIKLKKENNFITDEFYIANDKEYIKINKCEIKENFVTLTLQNEINIKKKLFIKYKNFTCEASYNLLYSCKEFNDRFYTDKPLGLTYKNEKTSFFLWSPPASSASVLLYKNGEPSLNEKPIELQMKEDNGYFSVDAFGDFEGYFYTYKLSIYNNTNEAVDPYAKAISINGTRGAIIDMKKTTPQGFYDNFIPEENTVIYELSIRDFSSSESSNIRNKKKFLGLCENETKNDYGEFTGLSHLKDLQISHVQLMPVYHFSKESTDEKDGEKYNWGYDPEDYNALEGIYSLDPYNPYSRIREFKEMIKTLHDNHIGVIMDVVYNHVFNADTNNLNKIFPSYYFRYNEDGTPSNGSCCNNDFASERKMAGRFILDSIIYLLKEFSLDGFRFDLMGLLDTNTMNNINKEAKKINKNVLIYGEGWDLNTTLPCELKANQINSSKMPGIGHFNDKFRDFLIGSVFITSKKGFPSGEVFNKSLIFSLICGSVVSKDGFSKMFESPSQSINYACSHDNNILRDRLVLSLNDAPLSLIKKINMLCAGFVLTSQGIPFIHCGEEFMRTKNLCENSFTAGDKINGVNWNYKHENYDLYNYYKGLISIRKTYEEFRIKTKEEIEKKVSIIYQSNEHIFAYKITGNNDTFVLIFNSSLDKENFLLDEGTYGVLANENFASCKINYTLAGPLINVEPVSLLIMKKLNN